MFFWSDSVANHEVTLRPGIACLQSSAGGELHDLVEDKLKLRSVVDRMRVLRLLLKLLKLVFLVVLNLTI